MKTKTVALSIALAGLLASAARAQETRRLERRIERQVHIVGGPGGLKDHTVAFSWLGDALDGKPVTGAPFTAKAVTEMEQPLADGNRIRQKTTATLARDSAGRTRRELALGALGPLVAGADAQPLVHIHDPAHDGNVTLDPARKLAFKGGQAGHGGSIGVKALGLPPPPLPGAGARAVIDDDVVFEAPVPPPPGAPGGGLDGPIIGALAPDAPKPVREDLGERAINGVNAQGQRTTVTIPAGKVGNERPLAIVSERWFAPELGVVVMSRHSDPRLGTTTYQLTDIDRREPPAALFEIPADYKTESGPVMIRRVFRGGKPGDDAR